MRRVAPDEGRNCWRLFQKWLEAGRGERRASAVDAVEGLEEKPWGTAKVDNRDQKGEEDERGQGSCMHQRHVKLGADIAVGIVVVMGLNRQPGGADHRILQPIEAGVIQLVEILQRPLVRATVQRRADTAAM